jgi:hypothetical protein
MLVVTFSLLKSYAATADAMISAAFLLEASQEKVESIFLNESRLPPSAAIFQTAATCHLDIMNRKMSDILKNHHKRCRVYSIRLDY